MSAPIIQADDTTFAAIVLQASEPVLVDFWAPWCPPCKLIAPIVDDLAAQYQGRLRVVTVNVDDSPAVAGHCGILANPTLLFFKQGREVHRIVGAWPRAKIAASVEQVLDACGYC